MIQITNSIPDSAASSIESLQNGAGTKINADRGSEILANAKVKIESLNNLKDAAKKAVELAS